MALPLLSDDEFVANSNHTIHSRKARSADDEWTGDATRNFLRIYSIKSRNSL